MAHAGRDHGRAVGLDHLLRLQAQSAEMLGDLPSDARRVGEADQRQAALHGVQAVGGAAVLLRQHQQEGFLQDRVPFEAVHVVERVRGDGEVGLLGPQQVFVVAALARMQRHVAHAETLLGERHEARCQRRGDRGEDAEAQHADRRRPLVAHLGFEIAEHVEDARRVAEQKRARLGESRRPHRAVEQRHAITLLECRNLLRGGGLRHAQHAGRRRHLPGFGHGRKNFHGLEQVRSRLRGGLQHGFLHDDYH